MVEVSAVCAGGAFPGCGTLRGIFQQSTFRKTVLVCALSAKKPLFEKNWWRIISGVSTRCTRPCTRPFYRRPRPKARPTVQCNVPMVATPTLSTTLASLNYYGCHNLVHLIDSLYAMPIAAGSAMHPTMGVANLIMVATPTLSTMSELESLWLPHPCPPHWLYT